MDRTSRTHFGMDERGLGGTYMIQQQFLHMYRRIQTAEKLIDNDPPTTGMFRRPTFSRFGDYWKRVQPVQFAVESKVDHAPPVSFPLLEDLYINQKVVPGASFEAAHRANQKAKKVKTARFPTAIDLQHAAVIEGVHVEGMPESMITYLGSIHKRKIAVAEEREEIRRRRLLRTQQEEEDAARREAWNAEHGNINALARDTLFSLDHYSRGAHAGGVPVVAEFGEEVLGSPVAGETYSSPPMTQESLMPLQSLVLRAPDGVDHDTDALHATRSSNFRAASMRSRATQSGVFTPKGGDGGESNSAPLKRSISALNPELLAASAPKKLARKPKAAAGPVQGFTRRPTSADAFIPNRSPRQASVTPHVPYPPPRRTVDTSMAGHQYAPILVPTLGTAAASPIVLPSGQVQQIPSKVVGLMQRYDEGDDCGICDDHHIR